MSRHGATRLAVRRGLAPRQNLVHIGAAMIARTLCFAFSVSAMVACAGASPPAAAPERDMSAYVQADKTEFEVGDSAEPPQKGEPSAHPIAKPTVASQGQKRGLFVVTKKSN